LFDVDVKGGLSIKRAYPDALLIFVRPPSAEILMERLRNRRTEDEETIARRMERVPMELELGDRFDHSIVNDVLERAVAEARELVAHHLTES
jgi:guanylate kinase